MRARRVRLRTRRNDDAMTTLGDVERDNGRHVRRRVCDIEDVKTMCLRSHYDVDEVAADVLNDPLRPGAEAQDLVYIGCVH